LCGAIGITLNFPAFLLPKTHTKFRRRWREVCAIAVKDLVAFIEPWTHVTNSCPHGLTYSILRRITRGEAHDTHAHNIRPKPVHRQRALVSARHQSQGAFHGRAKYVADAGGAYWLLDEIALIQPYEKAVAAEPFQVWTLKVREDRTATLSCQDENCETVYSKEIEYTDFPLPEITLWFADNTIYLPSEH
jgi:hypothetical protein